MGASIQPRTSSAPAAVKAKGFHVILDIAGVPAQVCEDDKGILDLLVRAATEAGTNVINSCRYHFGHNSPPGCTCFVMLDESHISAHSYADLGLLAIDVFTCGDTAESKADVITEIICKWLPDVDIRVSRLPRFVLPPGGA
ncbi:adenosylmethionine decarboxylase [bacterium]|nr:adenosylmethionine decarboxylase [bacterium]